MGREGVEGCGWGEEIGLGSWGWMDGSCVGALFLLSLVGVEAMSTVPYTFAYPVCGVHC
jgi:hypothetical protein